MKVCTVIWFQVQGSTQSIYKLLVFLCHDSVHYNYRILPKKITWIKPFHMMGYTCSWNKISLSADMGVWLSSPPLTSATEIFPVNSGMVSTHGYFWMGLRDMVKYKYIMEVTEDWHSVRIVNYLMTLNFPWQLRHQWVTVLCNAVTRIIMINEGKWCSVCIQIYNTIPILRYIILVVNNWISNNVM